MEISVAFFHFLFHNSSVYFQVLIYRKPECINLHKPYTLFSYTKKE